jgi:hypothetical protein
MPRGQAHRTVIAVPAATDGRSHEGAAATTLERVALVAPGARAEGNRLPGAAWSWPGVGSVRVAPPRREQVVVEQRHQVVWPQAWHDRVLRSVLNDGQLGSIGEQARSSQNFLQTHDRQHGTSPRRDGRRRAEGWDVPEIANGPTRPSSSPERQTRTPGGAGGMTRPGTWKNQPGTINGRRGPRGKPREPDRTSRRALGEGRGTKASEPSEPLPSRRSSGEQWRCASMTPLARWMISTRTVPAGLSISKGRTSGLQFRSDLRTGQIEPTQP